MNLLVLSFVVILLPMTSNQYVHYVKPSKYLSPSCPGQPCLTLDQYTQQTATYFTTGSTFLFLPGNHTLQTTIELKDTSDVEFRGTEVQDSTNSIIYGNGNKISCSEVVNFTIVGLILTENLQVVNSTGIVISNSIFQDIAGALYIRNSNITVIKCHFEGNSGSAINIGITNLEIIDSTFINNEAQNGGAIYAENSTILVKHTSHRVTFGGNFAKINGGAMYLKETFLLFNGIAVLFEDNFSNGDGGGIFSVESSLTFMSSITEFYNNSAHFGDGGAISSDGEIILTRNTFFIKNTAGNGGAVFGLNIAMEFYDNITFSNNSAVRGGAMFLQDAKLYLFTPYVNLTTAYNIASEYGGAIYYEDTNQFFKCDAIEYTADYYLLKSEIVASTMEHFRFIQINVTETNANPIAIYSKYNSAGIDGSFLYGGLVDRCQFTTTNLNGVVEYTVDYLLLKSKSKMHVIQPNSTIDAISSHPQGLCLCENNVPMCGALLILEDIHRGQEFKVQLIALTQIGTDISTTVTARLRNNLRIKSNQTSQKLKRNCSSLSYNVYSSEDNGQFTLHPFGPCIEILKVPVYVIFLPCPPGFIKSYDECICENRLRKYTTNCTITEDILITRNDSSTFWVNSSYENGSYHGLILCETCPMEYCKTETIAISLDNPDIQCALNRSGVLCGACITNHSLMLGSSRCHVCPNTYLALLLPFAAAGIALVFFLSIFRLTVATGMINSVILYANIVQVNRHLFFPINTVNVLTVFIAWMNLDLGFETCFYDGMTAYQQTWLQFAFPIYIWILIALIIITSRYSVRVSKLIGHNPIAVLATLLLMSYTKILKIIIDVYSFAKLEYPGNKIVTVWLIDGNMPYLNSWHLLLTVVTSGILIFLFIPYTLLLLLGYKLYHFSSKKYMRWLNRLKPLLDSYHAPYKTHTRYWTGLLLLVRCALYIVFSLGDANTSLLTIIITFVFGLAFALLRGKIYATSYINIIECLVYSNITVLSGVILSSGLNSSSALVYSLNGMVFFIMLIIIAYHFYMHYIPESLWLKVKYICNLAKIPKKEVEPSPKETKEVSKSLIELREPLLDN